MAEYECKKYIKIFEPPHWSAGKFGLQNIEDLVRSPIILRKYIVFLTFLTALKHYSEAGMCTIWNAVDTFEQYTGMFTLFYGEDKADELFKGLQSSTNPSRWDAMLDEFGPNRSIGAVFENANWIAYRMLEKQGSIENTAIDPYTESDYFNLISSTHNIAATGGLSQYLNSYDDDFD